MIERPGREPETRLQIFGLQIRHLLQQLFGGEAGREEIENVGNPNAHAAHTRSAAALSWIDGDPIGDLSHPSDYINAIERER